MFERCGEAARQVASSAMEAAKDLQHREVRPEHILLGLTMVPSPAAAALENQQITTVSVRAAYIRRFGEGDEENLQITLPFTDPSKEVFRQALREALRQERNFIEPEDLLLALFKERGAMAVAILAELGKTPDDVRRTLKETPSDAARQSESKYDRVIVEIVDDTGNEFVSETEPEGGVYAKEWLSSPWARIPIAGEEMLFGGNFLKVGGVFFLPDGSTVVTLEARRTDQVPPWRTELLEEGFELETEFLTPR